MRRLEHLKPGATPVPEGQTSATGDQSLLWIGSTTTTPAASVTIRDLERVERKLDEVLAKLDRLLNRRDVLSRRDREQLARILPAVAGCVGSEIFTSRDLIDHESAAVRLVVRGVTAKTLGRLLTRADGRPITGLVVERVGDEGHVALWRIAACGVFGVSGG